MKAFKCDRCGRLYLPHVIDDATEVLDGVPVCVICVADVRDYSINYKHHYDLCQECAKDFVLWFKTPALADIVNGTEGETNEQD